jgi:hypothetical protein
MFKHDPLGLGESLDICDHGHSIDVSTLAWQNAPGQMFWYSHSNCWINIDMNGQPTAGTHSCLSAARYDAQDIRDMASSLFPRWPKSELSDVDERTEGSKTWQRISICDEIGCVRESEYSRKRERCLLSDI